MEVAGTEVSLEAALVVIEQPTDVAEARRVAQAIASGRSLSEADVGRLGLVVTEAGRNLLKHAGGGEILLRAMAADGAQGVEMLALDRGPGIADVSRSFRDGFSTTGTPGTGLGAVARAASAYDIYSRPGQGTVLMGQVWMRSAGPLATRFRVGAVCRAMPGERECGDGWIFQERARGARLTLADGLGHGKHAAVAAETTLRTASEHAADTAPGLMGRIHAALRPTRGAAVAVAEIDSEARTVRFAGVGNIAAAIFPPDGAARRMVSHNGTAGHELRRIPEFSYPWSPDSLLLMHSDGLSMHWSLEDYPGLMARHPSVIAGVLYRDHARQRDDAAIVVAREELQAP
jgi:anti-sigma regulatory factor (Ser/Thr protein kinase)